MSKTIRRNSFLGGDIKARGDSRRASAGALKKEVADAEAAAEEARQFEIALNTAKAKAAYKAKLEGGDQEGAAVRAEREFHANHAQQIENTKKREARRLEKEEEMKRLLVDEAEREKQEEAEFEASKIAAMTASKKRRGSVAQMQDFMTTHTRKSSQTADMIRESLDATKAQVEAFNSRSAKLDSKIGNLNDDLEMQRKILDILARIKAVMDRRKKIEKMNPKARRIYIWAGRIKTIEFTESVKVRLHKLQYPQYLSCYTGIDWKTGRPFESESDSLSELTSNVAEKQVGYSSATRDHVRHDRKHSHSHLAKAGSVLVSSASSPRA
jgi:uncharacterized protein YoxC